MSKRKEDLIEYLDVLLQVNRYGIGCGDKINVALNELHKEMGFGSGEILSITIPQRNDEEVKRIAKELKEKMRKDFEEVNLDKVWIRGGSGGEITATYDGGMTITGGKIITDGKIETSKGIVGTNITENPFDTIE